MKRSHDDGGKGGSRAKRATTKVDMPCVVKFLAPEVLASAIIGKGGSVIADIRRTCDARIGLSDHGEFYPQTDCRVVTCHANSEDSLNEVSRRIIAKVGEVAKSGAWDATGQDGELLLRTLMPRAAAGGLIGKSGANIKRLREQTGAQIRVAEAVEIGPCAEQVVTATGSLQGLEHVMADVNKQIQMVNREPWFADWAATTEVGSSGRAGASNWSSRESRESREPREHRDDRHRDRGDRDRGSKGRPISGAKLMHEIADDLPAYVMEDERGFALSCVVPNRLVGGLIGRGGQGTKDVQGRTGTKIGIREIPGDPENRALNITGPLANTCSAYMLMMQRYLDSETAATK